MILALVAIASLLLCFGVFVYRHHVQEHRKERFLMKRHADIYREEHKRL